MRAVLQRVTQASVAVGGQIVGEITRPGLLVLLGVTHTDGEVQCQWIARKIRELRILDAEQSVAEIGAPVLLVSQFTLYAEVKKGRRPSWSNAAPGPVAEPLVERVREILTDAGTEVATGIFGAEMTVSLVNDGPVTLVVDTPR